MKMVGQSPAFARMSRLIEKYACCDAGVLIEGETGTGKELAARAIHYASARHARPFVPLNCGAIPETLIESELFGHKRGAFTDAKSDRAGVIKLADGGTLFLDEIDALPLKAQVALLRFLQDREYRVVGGTETQRADLRVIAATNAELHELIAARRFRADFYYRIGVLSLPVPPLRERGEDVLLLAEHFVRATQRPDEPPVRIDDASRMWLLRHAWPGNVRELENMVCRAVLMRTGPTITLTNSEDEPHPRVELPPLAENAEECREDSFRTARNRVVREFERSYLCRLMEKTRGNVSRAAQLAGKERRTLGKLLKKHGIDRSRFSD